jgi:type IV pilus assembly protein PilB
VSHDSTPAGASGTDHTPDDDLPASDHRLLDDALFSALRDNLRPNHPTPPTQLARLLHCPVTETGIGLVQFFMQTGLIAADELRTAKALKLKQPKLALWEALMESGFLGPRALAMGMAITNDMPYIDLVAERLQPDVIKYLDGETAERWTAFPVLFDGETLILAAAEPTRLDLEEIARFLERPAALAVGSRQAIAQAAKHWYGAEGAGRRIQQTLGQIDLRGVQPQETAEDDRPFEMDDTSIVQLVNQIISSAIQKGASDIHIRPEERFVFVFFRLDGKLYPQAKLPLRIHTTLVSRIKIISHMDIAERRLPQDGDLRVRLPDRVLDIRVSSVPSVRGESLVLRLLDHQSGLVQMEDLGFFPSDLDRLRWATALPYGLILLTGPTGSGKSTTLRAALDSIQTQEPRHVLTIEDPVEVKIDGVTQVNVKDKIGFTFAKALRHFLRHDPDVIMVGEIRDRETAQIAVQAALTGHLVFSTLHTNDAPGAITRLLEMDVESFLVSSAITLVIAQRLVRLLCPHCKQPYQITPGERRTIQTLLPALNPETLYRPRGCDRCNSTGFRGRTVIYEMLTMDEDLKALVASRQTATAIRKAAMQKGFRPLIHTGMAKVAQGTTTFSEAASYLDTLLGFL